MPLNATRSRPFASTLLLLTVVFPLAPMAAGQSSPVAGSALPSGGQTGVPRESGTVRAVNPHDLVVTNAAGEDIAVAVPDKAHILLVPPGSRDLSAAQPGTLADITAGDRVLVNGTPGDAGPALTATRVVVMKSTAIAANRAADEAAWARGAGGIVRSVDASTGVITVSSGLRTLTVDTAAETLVRRYASGSVRFEDAVKSNVAAIQPGDQLRVRGKRSPDGTTVVADEVVVGSFSNFSGIVSAVGTAPGTVTLKDLATKRSVTVTVTPQTNLRRLPPGAAQAMAARSGGAAGGQPGAAAGSTASVPPNSAPNAGEAGGGRPGGAGRAGADLSRMLNRLPTETLPNLKAGDAVMVVASNNPETGHPTAITLLVGVEQILAAAPSGSTTLSPWSLGEAGGGQGGEAGGGGGR